MQGIPWFDQFVIVRGLMEVMGLITIASGTVTSRSEEREVVYLEV
jgi:hypothetical protein